MMKGSSHLVVLLPVCNEGQLLMRKTRQFLNYFQKDGRLGGFEVWLLDNGSRDETFSLAKKLAGNDDRVKFLATGRRGIGLALKLGIVNSAGDYLYFTGIDNPFKFSDYEQFVRTRGRFDLVFASKNAARSVYQAPFWRRLFSIFYSLTLRLLFSIGLTDTQGSFWGEGQKIRRVLPLCTSNGPFFQTQLALYARLLGLKVGEVPVDYRTNGRKSRYKLARDGLGLLVSLGGEYFRYWLRWLRIKLTEL